MDYHYKKWSLKKVIFFPFFSIGLRSPAVFSMISQLPDKIRGQHFSLSAVSLHCGCDISKATGILGMAF